MNFEVDFFEKKPANIWVLFFAAADGSGLDRQ